MAVIYSESFITIPQKSEKVWCRWMLSGNVLAEVGSKLGRKPNVKQYVITACKSQYIWPCPSSSYSLLGKIRCKKKTAPKTIT